MRVAPLSFARLGNHILEQIVADAFFAGHGVTEGVVKTIVRIEELLECDVSYHIILKFNYFCGSVRQ